jgi:hypothetical protein
MSIDVVFVLRGRKVDWCVVTAETGFFIQLKIGREKKRWK